MITKHICIEDSHRRETKRVNKHVIQCFNQGSSQVFPQMGKFLKTQNGGVQRPMKSSGKFKPIAATAQLHDLHAQKLDDRAEADCFVDATCQILIVCRIGGGTPVHYLEIGCKRPRYSEGHFDGISPRPLR